MTDKDKKQLTDIINNERARIRCLDIMQCNEDKQLISIIVEINTSKNGG